MVLTWNIRIAKKKPLFSNKLKWMRKLNQFEPSNAFSEKPDLLNGTFQKFCFKNLRNLKHILSTNKMQKTMNNSKLNKRKFLMQTLCSVKHFSRSEYLYLPPPPIPSWRVILILGNSAKNQHTRHFKLNDIKPGIGKNIEGKTERKRKGGFSLIFIPEGLQQIQTEI